MNRKRLSGVLQVAGSVVFVASVGALSLIAAGLVAGVALVVFGVAVEREV